MRKRIVKSVVDQLEMEVRCEARHRGRGASGKNIFELERVASCRSRDHPVGSEAGFQQR